MDKLPFLKYEAAKFCDRGEDDLDHAVDAYTHIKSYSKNSALNWRDSSIILPSIRRDVSEWLKANKFSDPINLESVHVSGDESKIVAHLQLSSAHKYLADANHRKIFSRTHCALHHFGVDAFELRFDSGRVAKAEIQHSIYGVVIPLDGVGRNSIPQQSMYKDRVGIVYTFLKMGYGNSNLTFDDANFIFVVFGDRVSNYDQAIKALNGQENANRIKVAVVSAPISFGRDRRKPYSLNNLKDLKKYFDYVIPIGSHLLNKAGNSYRSITIGKNASRSAKNAIQTFVDLAACFDSPFAASDFKSRFDDSGFVLYGKSSSKSKSYDKKLQSLKLSMINIHIDFNNATNKVVIGGAKLEPNQFFREDMFQSTSIVVDSRFPKGSLKCLAFGSQPNPTGDEDAFFNAVSNIVIFKGIRVYRMNTSLKSFYANLSGNKIKICTSYSGIISKKDAESMQRSLENFTVCLVTRFSDIRGVSPAVSSMSINEMHYSEISGWLDDFCERYGTAAKQP